MTLYHLTARIGLLSTLAALSFGAAFAADAPSPTEPPALSDADVMSLKPDSPPPASTDRPEAAGRQLPKLTVRWSCGSCTHNEKVPLLLTQLYEQEAQKRNYGISSTETVELLITEFEQRSPGMRVMFGALAGTDKLSISIKYRGKSFDAQDYHGNAYQGMNDLCKVVMNRAFSNFASAYVSQ